MFNWFPRSSKSRPAGRAATVVRRSPPPGVATTTVPAWARQLHPQAQRVLATLPASVVLAKSCTQYPHAVEKLLANWESPSNFRLALDSMLIDTRGGRQGFPFEIVAEFSDLREYYDRHVHPVCSNAWGSIHAR